MTIDKEIRCVALRKFLPDNDKLEAELDMLERTRPKARIRYSRDNIADSNCMEIVVGMGVLGYVNADDKRYVEPLLRQTSSCPARFMEVYREEGHTPIVRFIITVDLDEVEPLRPGEEWEKWQYSFPVIPILDDLKTVTFAGNMLKDMIIRGEEDDFVCLDELIDSFVNASRFDMSVETSSMYDDLLFYLETSRNRNRKYINTLQHGSTVRRTDRMRDTLLCEWWPKFLVGEVSKRLCKNFTVETARRYGSVDECSISQEYERLRSELIMLPYLLFEVINDKKAVWAKMYYTHIPRQKFFELLSALILYTKLTDTVKNKQPFIVEEVRSTYIQNFESGSNASIMNL